MDCRDVLLDAHGRIREHLERHLEGLSDVHLAWKPGPQANPIGWLAWHIARVEDAQAAPLANRPQLWIDAGWHAKFARPADPRDNGYGQSPAEVAQFVSPSAKVLLEYYEAVHAATRSYLESLSCDDLDRVLDARWDPPVTVGVRLVSIIDDCAQHLGQIGYIRGLLP